MRQCVSYPLTGAGGFALGLITGVIGPSAIAATTYAMENVVLEHLNHQLSYLENVSGEAHTTVRAIYDDEKAHRDHAEQQLLKDSWMSKVLIRVVRASTNGVIWFGMR